MASSPPLLFDTRQLQRQQARAVPKLPEHRLLYDIAAANLCERLLEIRRTFSSTLVLGDVFGILHAALTQDKNNCGAITSPASAPEVLPDIETPVDAILAFMNLHTINDVPGYLRQCADRLRPDGLFLAVCLGGDSFTELRRAFLEADSQLYGRHVPRVAPMLDLRAAGGLLQRAGFALPMVDRQTLTFSYSSLLTLGRELRFMGLGNCLLERSRLSMGKKLLMSAHALYPKDDTGFFPLTLELVTLTGWRPASSQPQALKPGSGKFDLKKILNTL